MKNNVFDLTGKTALITGAGGLLGPKHAEAIIEYGGKVILTDHHLERVEAQADRLNSTYGVGSAVYYHMDVTDPLSVQHVVNTVDRIDILINNAAKDPKVKKQKSISERIDSTISTLQSNSKLICISGNLLL